MARTCYLCKAVMNRDETLWSEIFECAVIFYVCPNCGATDEEYID